MPATTQVVSIIVLLVPIPVLAQDGPNSPNRETPLSRALIPQGYTSISLKRDKRTGQLYLECLANGKPVCLLLDTGATHSAISIDIARQLKLTLKKMKGQVTGFGGNGQESTTARIDEFKVDGLLWIYLDVAVLDLSAAVRQAKQDGNIVMDGVLGASWFNAYSCVLDYSNDVLYCRDSGAIDQSFI